jgi:hypothetical protein
MNFARERTLPADLLETAHIFAEFNILSAETITEATVRQKICVETVGRDRASAAADMLVLGAAMLWVLATAIIG